MREIIFHLSVTSFLNNSEKEGKISLQRKNNESIKQIGSIRLNLAALVNCITPINLHLQIEPIPGIQIFIVVLPQSSTSPLSSSSCSSTFFNPSDLENNNQLTIEDSESSPQDCGDIHNNLSPICQEEEEGEEGVEEFEENLEDTRTITIITEELQQHDSLISSQVTYCYCYFFIIFYSPPFNYINSFFIENIN